MTLAPAITTGPGPLRLQVGCTFDVVAPAPTSAVLQVAPYPDADTSVEAFAWTTAAPHHEYVDSYGNRCERFALPLGQSSIEYRAQVTTTSCPDPVGAEAAELSPSELPDWLLHWLMPSRFCEADQLGAVAWDLFGSLPRGWSRVQSVCDYVHTYLEFVPGSSNPWTTASDAFRSRQGVCRDFAHLAIALCRALNVPSKYVFGYIPDQDPATAVAPMDFSAWFEAYLGDRWYTFDARINQPTVGRIVVGRGRDAIDVAMLTSLGAVQLAGFRVDAAVVTQP